VITIQNIALNARFLILSLLAATSGTSLSTRALARTMASLLFGLNLVLLKADLLVAIGDNMAHGGVHLLKGVLRHLSAKVARSLPELGMSSHTVL